MNPLAHWFHFQKGFLTLWIIIFLDAMSGQLIFPMMPHLIHHFWPNENVLSPFWLDMAYGAGLAVFNFAILWGAPFVGFLSDRWGRKRVLMGALWGQVFSSLLMILAIHYHAFWVLMVSRVLEGLSTFSNIPVIQSIFMDWSEGDWQKRGQYLSLTGLGITLGIAIGPMLGGFLVDQDPFWLAAPFLLLMVLSWGMMVALGRLKSLEPHITVAEKISVREAIKPVMGLLCAYLLFETAWSIDYITTGIHLVEWGGYSSAAIGVWFSIFGISLSVSLASYGIWGKMGVNTQVILGIGTIFVLVLGDCWNTAWGSFLATGILMAFVVPMVYINITNRLGSLADPRHYGVVMGASQTALALAWMLSGGLTRWLYHVHPVLPHGIAAALLLIVGFIWAKRSV